MARLKKLIKWGAVVIAAAVLAAFGYSEYLLTNAPDPVSVSLGLPSDEESLAEGKRLAQTRGCFGCHGENLEGKIFFDEPIFARVVTPNLTRILNSEPIEKLEAALRQGIGMDGRPLVLMPSDMYSYLSNEDTAKILAYLKTLPEVEDNLPDTSFGPMSRLFFIKGDFKTAPEYLKNAPPFRFNRESEPHLAKGEYLAMTMCSECHGLNLKGIEESDFFTPDLIVATTYSRQEFQHLMKTGGAPGGRELGLMAGVAQNRFSHLTEDEVASLYNFLLAWGEIEMKAGQ